MINPDVERCTSVHPGREGEVPGAGLPCVLPVGTNAYDEDRDLNVHVHLARETVGRGESAYRWEGESIQVQVTGDREPS